MKARPNNVLHSASYLDYCLIAFNCKLYMFVFYFEFLIYLLHVYIYIFFYYNSSLIELIIFVHLVQVTHICIHVNINIDESKITIKEIKAHLHTQSNNRRTEECHDKFPDSERGRQSCWILMIAFLPGSRCMSGLPPTSIFPGPL